MIFMMLFNIMLFSSTMVFPVSKTEFMQVNNEKETFRDMGGKDFIVISVREQGADGRFYAVSSEGEVWLSGVISSGAKGHRTPEGAFNVYYKKFRHMSTKYPDASGINNMDYSLFFYKGYALHKGNINAMSHGCIHVDTQSVKMLYKWAKHGTPIIVTKNPYMDFAREDLLQ